MAGKSYSLEISFTVNKKLSRKSVFFYCIFKVENILIGVPFTLRCHGNEYDDLLILFHFSSSETFFLQYAKFQ